jgi:hypothetical protein
MIFFYNFFKSVVNRKEPEPQFVIWAPSPEDNLISAPRLSAAAPNTEFHGEDVFTS